MIRRKARGLAAAAGLLLLFASARALPVPAPATLVKADARIVPGAGGTAALVVDATLASGWHVNSHPPSEDYLITTSLKLDPSPAVRFGDAKYPPGKTKKFAFAEKALSVYQGTFSIGAPYAVAGP